MAFYDQAPNKKRKPRSARTEQESWEDEGSRYRRSAKGPRAGYNGAGEHNPNKNKSFDRRPAGEGGESRRPYGERRDDRRAPGSAGPQRRFGPTRPRTDRGPARPAKRRSFDEQPPRSDYHDYEFRAPAPERPEAEPMERENLLVGRNPIREAIRSGRDIEKLLVQRGELSGSAREIVMMAREAHIVVQEVEKSRLDEIAPHHQGMLAFASAYKYAQVEDMLALAAERHEAPFLVLLDGVTDPHNLGAVIRTAECAGAHGVIVPARRSVGLTPAAVKASAGAVEHLMVARVTNLNRTIEELKTRNIWTYAVTMDGEDYEKVNFRGGVALVIGAEGEGISRLTLEMCDQRVSLPLKGQIDSLNASVAAGIVMYRVLSARTRS